MKTQMAVPTTVSLPSGWLWLGLLAALCFPSLGLVQQVLAVFLPRIWPGVDFPSWLVMLAGPAGYIFAAALILVWLTGSPGAHRIAKWGTVPTGLAVLLTLLVLMALFVWLYPLTTAGLFNGGSDRDEALNMAVNELLAGRYPYYPLTYVPGLPHELGLDGNPISPMPGELLLALPFVWLGNGAWQTFFWLLMLMVMLLRWMRPGVALLAFWSLLLCAPVSLNEIVSGGDLLPISLWVMIFAIALTHSDTGRRWPWILLLGIGLASRMNFLLILPLVTGEMVRQHGWRRGIVNGLLVALVCAGLILPFYVYDPAGFSPLHAYNLLGRFDSILPAAGLLIPGVAGVLALVLAGYQVRYGNQRSLAWGCALVLLLPVLAAVILSSIQHGRPEFFHYAWYGLGAMVFAWIGAWLPAANANSD